MNELIDGLMGLGRRGAAICLAVGALSGAGFAVCWMQGIFVPVLAGVGVLFGLLGVLLLSKGDSLKTVKIPPPGTFTPALGDRIRTHPQPFHFCTRCMVFCEYAVCEQCDRTLDVLTVNDGRDLNTLMAAIEP